MRTRKLVVVGLAAYGGYMLWKRYGGRLAAMVGGGLANDDRRVHARAELNVTEWAAGSDDPLRQAGAIIADSDERAELPPDAPGIERRRSEDTVEP